MAFGPSLKSRTLLLAAALLTATSGVGADSVSGTPASYRGKAVATPRISGMDSQPTLIYNCAKMPAICNNVAQVEDMDEDTRLLKEKHLVFHYHLDRVATKARRAASCPAKKPRGQSWYDYHQCPEPDQPLVVLEGGAVNLEGEGDGNFFKGDIMIDPKASNKELEDAPSRKRMITDADTGQYTGLFWSCDEWPAASWVEGGTGFTYCAPMSQKCSRPLHRAYREWSPDQAPVPLKSGLQLSEQDFQAVAHGDLYGQVGKLYPQGTAMEFHFYTTFDQTLGGPFTQFKWYEPDFNGGRIEHVKDHGTFKRDADSPQIVEHINHYYGNGSVKHVTRNLSKRAFLIARGLQADPYDSTGTTEDQPTPAFTELSFTTITERSNMDEPAEFCYRCDHINSPDDDVGSEGYEDPPTDDTCDPIK